MTVPVLLPTIVQKRTPNQSSRNGQQIVGIVIHETEGSYVGAVSWLCNPKADASAHLVLREDGAEATQLVAWSRKAWHAVNANPYTLGLELAGKTSQPNSAAQMARAARIVGYWCKRFNIPAKQGDSVGRGGIVRHRDLGQFGGGHNDPGGFDWPAFLKAVRAEVARDGYRPVWGID